MAKKPTYYAVLVNGLSAPNIKNHGTIYGPFVANDPGEAVSKTWNAIVTGKGTKSGAHWAENRRAFREHVKAGGSLQLTISNSAVELETTIKVGAAYAAAATAGK